MNLKQTHLERDTILNETTACDETWAVLLMHHPYSPQFRFDQNLLPKNLMVIVALDIEGGFNIMLYQKVE
jgi:hypothetical protein